MSTNTAKTSSTAKWSLRKLDRGASFTGGTGGIVASESGLRSKIIGSNLSEKVKTNPLQNRYGRLTPVALFEQTGSSHEGRRILCVCDCGIFKDFAFSSLKSGDTRSCGCLLRARNSAIHTSHGHCCHSTRSPEYNSWD